MSIRTVLFDLTPLDTPSRVRGIGRYVRSLAKGLASLPDASCQGLRILGITSLGWDGSCSITEDLASFEGSIPKEALSKKDHYRWAYRRRVALWRAVRRVQADLVHLGDPNATPLAMDLTRCKRVVTCHDLIPLQFPKRYLKLADGLHLAGPKIIQRRYRSADHIIAISDATVFDLVNLVGIPKEKLTRVYNGVDLARWSAEVRPDDETRIRRLSLSPSSFLLYVGDTDWRKNVEGMIGALSVARQRGLDVVLAFAGKLEPHKILRIQQTALEAGVGSFIKLLGFVSDEDLGALFRQALAHLFVSRSEGFGFTIVEAMASGCPVITTHLGSLGEVAGEAALLVNPDDPTNIASAALLLAQDSGLRQELIRRGLERAPTFSNDRQAKAVVDVYWKVLCA